MVQDRPLLGLLFMLGFCALAPLSDAYAKVVGDHMAVVHLVTTRFVVQLVILLPIIFFRRDSLRISRRLLGLLTLRTLLQMSGLGLIFTALLFMPLADAIAIAYVMPFLMLLLGYFVLNEQVGSRRLIACAVGFAGTLMVMQPSFAEVGWVATLPLLVAVVFSAFMLVTRMVARDIEPLALQSISGIIGCLVLVPASVLTHVAGWGVIDPNIITRTDIWMLIAMGALGTGSHLCMVASLRFAPASTVAPMQYIEIPFAALFGWLMFHDFPNGLALFGICVVMGAGLYIIWREQKTMRTAAP